MEDGELGKGFIQGNIPLVINSYVDIFSSFDSRPLAEKALSVDFLSEVKRAARDKDEFGLELTISIPKDKRILSEEFKIKKRLREHFHKHFLEKEHEVSKIKKEGMAWVVSGIILLIVVLYSLFKFELTIWGTILPIFEIPGWFLVWEGMDKILIDARQFKPDMDFYKKMSAAQIIFRSY